MKIPPRNPLDLLIRVRTDHPECGDAEQLRDYLIAEVKKEGNEDFIGICIDYACSQTVNNEFNATSSIEEIGSTEPTYNARPVVFVNDDGSDPHYIPKEHVFNAVARAVSALKEIEACIVPSDISVRHSVTRKLLTEEWLFEYLAKAINFKHLYHEEDDGKVPAWLPRMIVERGKVFSAKMW
jgi:hypothetical protein